MGRLSVRVALSPLGRRLAAHRVAFLATVSLRGRNLPSVAWTIPLGVA
jgi:hypothetical protein